MKPVGNNRNQAKLLAFFVSLVRNHYSKYNAFSFSYSKVSVLYQKLFQISLSDIIEKMRCCCGGQVIVEDHCEFEESNDKEHQEYSGEDFDIID